MDGWRIYGLAVVALFIKMFSAVLVQGYGRYQHRGFNNPEDAVMFEKLFGKKPNAAQRSELVDRAQSVLRNDGENIPIFLFIAMSYLQLGCWEQGFIFYASLFVMSRIAHMISYLRAIQPWRNLSYQLGLWITFIMAVQIVLKAVS